MKRTEYLESRYNAVKQDNEGLRLKLQDSNAQIVAAYMVAADDIKKWMTNVLEECDKEYSFADNAISFTSKMREYLDATD